MPIFIEFLAFFSLSLNLMTHNMEYMFHFFIRMKNVRMMAQIYFEMRWGWHLLTFSDRRETDSHLSFISFHYNPKEIGAKYVLLFKVALLAGVV